MKKEIDSKEEEEEDFEGFIDDLELDS